MPKIVSRVSEAEDQLRRLREIVEIATGGAIGPDGEEPAATNMDEAITHVDIMAASLLDAIDNLEGQIGALVNELDDMSFRLISQDVSTLAIQEALQDGVEFDEDLNDATVDAMELMISAGMAEATANGEIAFDSAIVISREDFKPIIREALSGWLERKLG